MSFITKTTSESELDWALLSADTVFVPAVCLLAALLLACRLAAEAGMTIVSPL